MDANRSLLVLVERDAGDDVVRSLAAAGWDVERVVTSSDALDRLSSNGVAGVVSSFEHDDDAALDVLRTMADRSDVPFVLCTDDGCEALASDAIAAGVDEYVPSGTERDRYEKLRSAVDRATGGSADASDEESTGLNRAHEQLAHALSVSNQGFWDWDPRTDEVQYSRQWAAMLGYDVDDLDTTFETWQSLVHPDDRDRVAPLVEAVRAGDRAEYDTEFRLRTADGEWQWILSRGAVVEWTDDGRPKRVVGTHTDVGDRKSRQRALQRFDTVVQTLPDVIWTLDADLTVTYVNRQVEAVYGIPADEIPGRPFRDVVAEVDGLDESTVAALTDSVHELLAGDREEFRTRITIEPDGEKRIIDVHVVPLTEDGDVVGVAGVNRDVTEQTRRANRLAESEREMTALHDTARRLLQASTATDVAELVVDAAADVLDLSGVAVYLYDREDNVLRSVADSGEVDSLYGHLPDVGPGEGITGDVFLGDETVVLPNVHEDDRMLNDAAGIRSGLFIPLGEHGILVAGDTDVDAFDEGSVERAELLAANAEAALERTYREQTLREQDRTLQAQNRRLEQLNEVNEGIRRIDQALVRADTREQIEAAVCEQLVSFERFGFAWIGSVDPGNGHLEPRTAAGDGRAYLDHVTVSPDADEAGEPAGRAAATGAPAGVANVADDLGNQQWRHAALVRDFRSILALPLEYESVTYGVLTIYADHPDAFDDLLRNVLVDLADTIAYALNAVEQRSALLSEHRVEYEFDLDGVDDAFSEVAVALGRTVHVVSVVPRKDGSHLVYARIPGNEAADGQSLDEDEVLTAAAAVSGVEAVEFVDEEMVRYVTDEPSVAVELSDMNARPDTVELRPDGGASVRVTLPADANVNELVQRLEDVYPSVTLTARRQSPQPPETIHTVEEDLSQRQREVLEAAYHGGFFEWPRENTGEDIASTLGISQPSFLQHLRASERKLVTRFLGQSDEE